MQVDMPVESMHGEDEEAVAGGLHPMEVEEGGDEAKSRDGLQLVGGGGVVEGDDDALGGPSVADAVEEGQGGLAVVVGEEEIAGGGRAAPGGTDGAVAEEGFGRQPDEDLPYHELIREAVEKERCLRYCGHGWELDILFQPSR